MRHAVLALLLVLALLTGGFALYSGRSLDAKASTQIVHPMVPGVGDPGRGDPALAESSGAHGRERGTGLAFVGGERRVGALVLSAEDEAALDDLDLSPNAPQDLVEGPTLSERYPNGELHFQGAQIELDDGTWVREGPWTAWHENGEVDELGAYKNDVEHGLWNWWHENGSRKAKGEFVDGEREGTWSFWYDDGGMMMTARYWEGEAQGRWVYYHADGSRAAEGDFERGELHGRWSVWFEDGTLNTEKSGLYDHGTKVSE